MARALLLTGMEVLTKPCAVGPELTWTFIEFRWRKLKFEVNERDFLTTSPCERSRQHHLFSYETSGR